MGITCTADSYDMFKMEKINLNGPKLVSLEYKSDDFVNFTLATISLYKLPNQCSDPDIPLHTYTYRYTDAEKNTSYDFRPELGYQIIGNNKLYCNWNKQWSDNPPIVAPMITCQIPSEPDSIYVPNYELKYYEYSNLTLIATIGTSIIFNCKNESMILIGQRVQFCKENGEWDSTIPLCESIQILLYF